MKSINPATQETVWEGTQASESEILHAIDSAKRAQIAWQHESLDTRMSVLRMFSSELLQHKAPLAKTISQEMGKPLWESLNEVQSMINKVEISIAAYHERCKEQMTKAGQMLQATRFKPHGVVAVLGPFNFPGHLPNGHIVPALLAGNAVIFKPSELTPMVAEVTCAIWKKAGLPDGLLQLLQGPKEVATRILQSPDIQGVYFTGSVAAGRAIQELSFDYPNRIVALEMGGNNPLVVSNVANLQAAVWHVIQSAYLTSGQRCSCARRLIITDDTILAMLIETTQKIQIGSFDSVPEPFMGPVVSKQSADKIVQGYEKMLAMGAKPLVPLVRNQECFLHPAIVDTSSIAREDAELFGPLLQVIRVKNFAEAIKEANNSRFGLCASLLSDNEAEYSQFYAEVKAGCINWNMPTTGANSRAPFGGLGLSGNYRPSGYFAADYCSYPVASQENSLLLPPDPPLLGMKNP